MNRLLIGLNACGVFVLGLLCIAQWRVNLALNSKLATQTKANWELTAKLEDSAKSIKGSAADLDGFRQQIVRNNATLNENRSKLAELDIQQHQLTAERDQLKTRFEECQTAILERDNRLKEANARIQKLGTDRNEAVIKFNELAAKYNSVVKDLNAATARLAELKAATKPAPTGNDPQKQPRTESNERTEKH